MSLAATHLILSGCARSDNGARAPAAVLEVHRDLEPMRARMSLPEGTRAVRYVGGPLGTSSLVPGPTDFWLDAYFELAPDSPVLRGAEHPEQISVRADAAEALLGVHGEGPHVELTGTRVASATAWARRGWSVRDAFVVRQGLYVRMFSR
jgi:hypothetical protein